MTDPGAERIERFIRSMPKVELHLHLEGAIPPEILLAQIHRKGSEPAIRTIEDLRKRLTCTDFENFIDIWIWKNTFIKEEKDFEAIAYGVLAGLSHQNVKYVEAFYGPGDYHRHGLAVEAITESIIRGKARAERDFGIRCQFIVDLIRDHGPEIGMKRLDEVTPFLGQGVVGIGIGGSEQIFPALPYAEVYQEARRRGFRLTAHAGEVAGADSIRSAVEDLGVDRIGHGLRAYEDPGVVAMLRDRRIPLEMCVISNVKTGVCRSIEDHPIKDYFKQGLMVTVNSDDPTMFNATLTDEYLALARKLGFALEEIRQVALNGIEASFLPVDDKAALKATFEREWAASDSS